MAAASRRLDHPIWTGLSDAALAGNRVPLEPLTVSSLQTVPGDVEGLLPPGLVMHSALESMTS